jgi:hypothetical protein
MQRTKWLSTRPTSAGFFTGNDFHSPLLASRCGAHAYIDANVATEDAIARAVAEVSGS